MFREGQLVRVAGWISLVAGALLCATLVWAALGFLLMGVGLLSLLVAENNRKRASRTAASGARADQPMAEPAPIPESLQLVDREAPEQINSPAGSYDRQAWRRLVESDADLARVTSVLADYGQQYVDELAEEYLADIDKQRLPEIVEGIIGRAGKGVAPRGSARPAVGARPLSPIGGSNAVADGPDRQTRPLPEATSPPVEPAKQETVGATVQAPIAAEPPQSAEDRNRTITSADQGLAGMLGKLSSDSASPGKN
jgi:hypothetical protein